MSEELGFVVTDDDCLQCCKKVGDDSYHLVQYDEYPMLDDPYRIVEATIDLSDYSEQELLDYLKPYGYSDLGALGDMGLMAEIIFETDAQELENPGRYKTFEEVGQAIEKITGLDLREYYVDKTEIIYTAESGKEYTRADFDRIVQDALNELSTQNPEEYQRIMNGIIPQASDILRDQLISLADWQSVETLADEFLNDPEVHFPPEDEWTAEDWKALAEKHYPEKPTNLLSTVYTKEDIASFKEKTEKTDKAPSLISEAKDARDASNELSQITDTPEKGRDDR